MNLVTEVSPLDAAIHGWCMQLLTNVTTYVNFPTLVAAMPFTFSGSESTLYLAGSLTTPPVLCVMDIPNRRLLVVGCGAESATQLAAVLQGYFANRVSPGNVQQPFATFADSICAQIVQPLSFTWSQIRFVGYSYGGATVVNMPYQMANMAITTDYKVYCYGVPKPCRFGDRNLFNAQNIRNVVRYDDPVPAFPPILSRVQLPILSICSNAEAQNMADWVQPCTRLLYSFGGEFGSSLPYTAVSPSLASVYITFSSWIAAVFSTSGHSLASYQSFILQLPVNTTPSVEPVTQPDTTRRDIPTSNELNTDRVIQQIASASIVEANPGAATATAVQAILPVKGIKWRGGKNLGYNALFYGTQFVVYVRRRRTLRGLVRRLNKLELSN